MVRQGQSPDQRMSLIPEFIRRLFARRSYEVNVLFIESEDAECVYVRRQPYTVQSVKMAVQMHRSYWPKTKIISLHCKEDLPVE